MHIGPSRVAAVTLALGAMLSPAARGAIPDADDAPGLGTQSVVSPGALGAQFINPALLGAQAGNSISGWLGYRAEKPEVWHLALHANRVGLGFRSYWNPWRPAPTGPGTSVRPRRELSVATGSNGSPPLSSAFLGQRLRRAWGEDQDAWRWDAGLVYPPLPWLVLGLVARDLAQDRLDGVLLRRTYQAGLLLGPVRASGAWQAHAFGDVLGVEGQRWADTAVGRVGLALQARSGLEVRLVVESKAVEGERATLLAAALTLPLGGSQLLGAAAQEEEGRFDRPLFGFGFAEKMR